MNGINGYPSFGPRGVEPARPRPVDNAPAPASTPGAVPTGDLPAPTGRPVDRAPARHGKAAAAEYPTLRTPDRDKALRDTVKLELSRAFGARALPGMEEAVLSAFESSESLQTLFNRFWSSAS